MAASEQTSPVETLQAETDDFGLGKATRKVSSRKIIRILRGFPILPGLVLFIVLFSAIFGEYLAPRDPRKYELGNTFAPPFWQQDGTASRLLGTDNMGRDVFSRLIAGARISVIVALTAIFIAGTIGTSVGLISGYTGGKVDAILMRVVDVQLSIPYILLALILVAALGASLRNVIIVIGIAGWPGYARVVRGEVLSIKGRDFVALARVLGCGRLRIMLCHVFPQVLNTLIILATLQVGTVMIFEASLSFLGLGVQPPTPSWGLMLADGRNYLSTAWWISAFPGLVILFTCLSANLVGDWFRDRFDPRLRQL